MSERARYTISVYDEYVEIDGTLTIREGFDFLSFFDQQGFNTIDHNYDGTTLTLRKRDFEKEERTRIIEESISDNKHYERLYNAEKSNCEKHIDKIKQFESLVKQIMEDGKEKEEMISMLNNELSKCKSLLKLEQAYKEGKIHVEYVGQSNEGITGQHSGSKDSCESSSQ